MLKVTLLASIRTDESFGLRRYRLNIDWWFGGAGRHNNSCKTQHKSAYQISRLHKKNSKPVNSVRKIASTRFLSYVLYGKVD